MNSFRLSLLSGLLIGVLLFVASAPPRALADKIAHQSAVAAAALPQYIVAAVNAPERPAADKERDATRHPEQTMAFFGIKPGMQVADLWAAGGYTTELLARIVGPTGKVYSQNIEFPEKFKSAEETWHKRTSEPGLSNVVEVIKPFDAPDVLPVAPGTLDAVLINLNYHDLVARNFDRAKLNAAVFKALKPGGIYGTVDNSAQAGSGARDVDTLHRIDEQYEIAEITKAGFRLTADADFLRNPKDDRTQPFWKIAHHQDCFVLKFVKPE
ncbi:MAG: class I SAM-dependent methyltransferase [Candidatus Binataceae bacterium]